MLFGDFGCIIYLKIVLKILNFEIMLDVDCDESGVKILKFFMCCGWVDGICEWLLMFW